MSDERHLFVFTAPYKVHDPAAMARRAAHRPAHVERLLRMWDDGTVRESPPPPLPRHEHEGLMQVCVCVWVDAAQSSGARC